jgi:hypothetical protein
VTAGNRKANATHLQNHLLLSRIRFSRLPCSFTTQSCSKVHRQPFSVSVPWLYKRRGEHGRNRKQGWAEFFSPSRRFKNSLSMKVAAPRVIGACLSIFTWIELELRSSSLRSYPDDMERVARPQRSHRMHSPPFPTFPRTFNSPGTTRPAFSTAKMNGATSFLPTTESRRPRSKSSLRLLQPGGVRERFLVQHKRIVLRQTPILWN